MKYPRKIYAIKHEKSNRIYIGSSNDVENRIKSHLYALRCGKHTNKHMQSDFNNLGEYYKFYILDDISSREELHKEYQWQLKYKSKDPKYGYNDKDKGGSGKKIKFEEELPTIDDSL